MQRKEEISFKDLDKYEGVSVEYPPNPPIGKLDIKDFKLDRDPVKYIENLSELAEKRFGVKREDLFRRELPVTRVTPGKDFFLEFVLLYLDGQPTETIMTKLTSGESKYKNLNKQLMHTIVARYFSPLVKEIARDARQASKLHSILFPESKEVEEQIKSILKELDLSIFEVFDINSSKFPTIFPKIRYNTEIPISEVNNFIKAIYFYVCEKKRITVIAKEVFEDKVTVKALDAIFTRSLTRAAKNKLRELKGFKFVDRSLG